jgi:hypothetical protein
MQGGRLHVLGICDIVPVITLSPDPPSVAEGELGALHAAEELPSRSSVVAGEAPRQAEQANSSAA